MPEVGDTYAARLDDGRFGVVRVLRKSERSTLVAVADWIGAEPPSVNHRALRRVLRRERGFFKGEPAVAWYEGEPPEGLIYLGVIQPSAADLTIDPKGTYAGYWRTNMAADALLEWSFHHPGELVQLGGEPPPPEVPIVGPDFSPMPDARFWEIVALVGYSEDNPTAESAIACAVQELTGCGVDEIFGFEAALTEKLFALDKESYARHIGSSAYAGPDSFFSVDIFLYARCAVVAKGRLAYEQTLLEPKRMPQDHTFEPLLYLASEAYERKTGRVFTFHGPRSYETFSNREGWT